ncbi:hypothetical protein C8R45DRAFT_1077521 [Mycena sanguinolenta]|nr:hypothetical protein C8R45DRAFT_1077521 [Mycena sanguinolenta]
MVFVSFSSLLALTMAVLAVASPLAPVATSVNRSWNREATPNLGFRDSSREVNPAPRSCGADGSTSCIKARCDIVTVSKNALRTPKHSGRHSRHPTAAQKKQGTMPLPRPLESLI